MADTHSVIVALVASGAGSALATWFLIPILGRLAMDVPNARSSHDCAVPRAGGIGLAIGVAAGYLTWWLLTGGVAPIGVIAGQLAFGSLGALDDFGQVRVRTRLVLQLAIGIAIVAADASLDGSDGLGLVLAIGVGAVFVAGFVNSFNFMDGINAISSVTTLVAASWYYWLALALDVPTLLPASLALAGAAVGFLLWNRSGAIFLGDTGSYFIGGSFALMALHAWSIGVAPLLALAPLVLYVFDTGWTVFRHLWRRQAIGVAHRDHVYQRLADLDVSHLRVSLIVGGLTALIVGVAWLFRENPVWTVASWASVCCLYGSMSRFVRNGTQVNA